MKSVYALTCFTDEAQLPRLTRSLREQEGVRVAHDIITGKDALTAERTVHELSLQANEFDAIIKIDADMTLTGPSVLAMIVGWFDRNPGWQRLTLPVRDYYLGQFILGMHSYRPAAVPPTVEVAEPNPDAWLGTMRGRSLYGLRQNLVDHSFDPTPSQAIRFGLHRGIKARLGGARHRHWVTVHQLCNEYLRRRQERGLQFALLGALIGAGATAIPAVSFAAVNHNSVEFSSILAYCLDQELRGFPLLNESRLNLKDMRSTAAIPFGSLKDAAYLQLRSTKVKLLVARDTWLCDDVSTMPGGNPSATVHGSRPL